ncbi:MAG TPA: ATP phosphoribosyltransferase [Bacteroidetes bacterium]|nr:ATP phosphoribosyltransferase [Bacteroidota bacterium]
MIANNGRLKIAIQKSGRLTDDSLSLLRACGLDFEFQKQSLYSPCRNFDIDVLALRDDDIPEYVQDAVADLGIVGENIVREKQARVETISKLGYGHCRLSLSVPQRSSIRSVEQLRGKRIATTYPSTLRRYLRRHRVRAEIIELSGAVELAPTLDVADAICDIVSTGTTARVNGLRPLETVLISEAALVANRETMRDPKKKILVERLLIRISGSLQARGKRYMMMNAPTSAIPRLKRIIPSLKSPTIVPLAEEGMVALHSVIAEDVFWDVMENLKKAGASDIVVVPIETIIK